MTGPRRLAEQPRPQRRTRVSRVLRDAGSVVGLAVQVLLALVGMAVVSEALEGEPGPLLLIWCLVGTCYLLVMVVAVGVDSLHRRPFPPTRVQANVVVRWTSLSASLITAAVGLVAAFMILIGDPTRTSRRSSRPSASGRSCWPGG